MTSGRGIFFMFVAAGMAFVAVGVPELRNWWWFGLMAAVYVFGGGS